MGVVAGALLLAAISGCTSGGYVDAPVPAKPVQGLVQQLTVCPGSPAPARPNALPGTRDALLPFDPSSFVLCRYGGLNSGHSQALMQQQRVTTEPAVARLAAVLRTGNPVWSGSGTTSCPADFGTATTLFAEDGPRGGWLVLHADRTGCPTIRNGFINAHISDALAAQLTRLGGAPGM